MTDADTPSENDSPPPWLIVTGVIAALGVIFVLGVGYGQQWGAPQWGPLASWIAGAATFGAVVVALREARRGHLARLVDHEVSRRRECIKTLGDLWGALVGLEMDSATWTGYLDDLPSNFNPNAPRLSGPLTGPQTYGDGIREEIRNFSFKWQNSIEPPLFVALLILRGTALYDAVAGVNDKINEIKREGLDGIKDAVSKGRRPETEPISAIWKNVIERRDDHLSLARQHFSLDRNDVEQYVRQNWKR